MRLISVEFDGYKRFAGSAEAKINTDGKVIAIVGPNEAGKTSLLEALELLEDTDAIPPDKLTRLAEIPEDHVVVKALFLLDAADREAIANLHGARAFEHYWFTVSKLRNGQLQTALEPRLRRDIPTRNRRADEFDRVRRSPWLREEPDDEESALSAAKLETLVEALRSDRRYLGGETLAALDAAIGRLRELSGGPKYAQDLPDRLEALHDHEAEDHPNDQACEILRNRRPEFLSFSGDARNLGYEYDLSTEADFPNDALGNLTGMAGLDLVALRHAIQTGDTGTAAHLVEQANQQLKDEFASWTQSGVRPHLDRGDGLLLHVHASNEAGGYMKFTERSAGLRAFVALVAMTADRDREVKPILLVDGAETDLHYDAQADLVRVFIRQDAAAQVMYTTHSAGCLPEDLGTGVRIIEPIEGTNHSRIRNKFWTKEPGFSPLLLGMGASTLAFFPRRSALITEGPTELIMLGVLLREATGRDELRFQITPGSSSIRPAQIAGLDLQATETVWLVDGDKGGRAITKKLTKNQIPTTRIVVIGSDPHSGLVAEDLVESGVYLDAVNEEIGRRGSPDAMPASALSDKHRPESVAKWCKAKGIAAPDKIAIAHHVVEMRTVEMEAPRSLVDSERLEVVEQLHADVLKALGNDSAP